MKKITQGEAVHGFVQWLTSRFEQVTFSIHNHSEKGLDLAERYCKAQGWKVPSSDRLDELDDTLETPLLEENER